MVFHVLNRGNDRRDLFDDRGDFEAFLRVMRETQDRFAMRILAYCLMSNHWHLLLWPVEDGDLGAFMQRLTTTHVRRWHLHRHSVGLGHLYQGTYKSFPAEGDDHFFTVARYVERNALRANLVKKAEKWLWSSLAQRLGDAASDELPSPIDAAALIDHVEIGGLRPSDRRERGQRAGIGHNVADADFNVRRAAGQGLLRDGCK